MAAVPKPPPLRSKKRLDAIRALSCVVCGTPPPSEAAHVRMGLAGGVSMKPGDDLTVALCRSCHRQQHHIGEREFWLFALTYYKSLLRDVLRAYARSLYLEGK